MLRNPPTYLFVHRKLPSKSDAVKGKKIPLTDAYLGTQKQSFNPANSLEFKSTLNIITFKKFNEHFRNFNFMKIYKIRMCSVEKYIR